MNFGKWVIQKLDQQNISQYRLEKEYNLAKGSVYRWAYEKNNPRLDSIVRTVIGISDYTGESLDALLLEAFQSTPEYKEVKHERE